MPQTLIVNIKDTQDFDIRIDRSSKWGNPFLLPFDSPATRKHCIERYEEYLRGNAKLLADLPELVGKRLGCWCKPQPCHGDVLIKLMLELGLESE